MACPYFNPREPWPEGQWTGPSRLPLGQPWLGDCLSPDRGGGAPDESTQRQFCNFGYARGLCSRFPACSEADAHRFSLAARRGAFFDVIWIAERDCAPLRHARREVLPLLGDSARREESDVAWRQAEAFALACSTGKLPPAMGRLDDQ